MILKASQRSGGAQLALHLMKTENEHVEVHEVSGFIADDLAGAFKEIHAISKGTQCKQYLFSLSLNPPEAEDVPIAVFEDAIARIEKKMGLSGQPRAIVFHEKQGRRHAHCVWSRIDASQMKAINLPLFKRKLMEISRQVYLEQGWQIPPGLVDWQDRDPLNYSQAEAQQAKRVKHDTAALKALFQSCWAGSDSRVGFTNALREQGFVLARGDRRSFVAVDGAGEVYSLSRWCSIKTKEIRARLGDAATLPNIEEAIELLGQRVMAGSSKLPIAQKHIDAAIAWQNHALQNTVGANLSAEQEIAIRHVTDPNQLSCVVGLAGAGKSTMLSAARHAWQKQGLRVIGAALAGKAADGLQSASGIESRTLASLEHGWKNGYGLLSSNDVLVIDEAGMVGTKQLARIVVAAKTAGAKIVLIGDPEQLQPIQAGRPFKEFARDVGAKKLSKIRRQKQEWQCRASRDLAEGHSATPLNKGLKNLILSLTADATH